MIGSMVRKMIPVAALAAALVCGAARAASAESYISPFLGYNFGGDAGCPAISNCENKSLNWGVAFGSIGGVFGSEAEISYAPNFFGETPGTSSNVFTFMGNFMLAPKFGIVQPYGVVGLGLIKSHAEFTATGLLESDNNDFGWDIGGGLIVYFGQHFGVRGDIRYFHAFPDLDILGLALSDAKLDFGRASAAAVFKF
jgi:opacity protein-like surface antigen